MEVDKLQWSSKCFTVMGECWSLRQLTLCFLGTGTIKVRFLKQVGTVKLSKEMENRSVSTGASYLLSVPADIDSVKSFLQVHYSGSKTGIRHLFFQNQNTCKMLSVNQ